MLLTHMPWLGGRYALAQRCWHAEPAQRPSLADVHAELQLEVLRVSGVAVDAGGSPVHGTAVVLEFPRSKLRFVREVARTGSAVVKEYEASGLGASKGATRVAARMLGDGATEQERGEFAAEVRVMETMAHRHIVAVVGVVTVSGPSMVLTEWMDLGSVADVVAREALSPAQLLGMAQDIAAGMEYLAHRRTCWQSQGGGRAEGGGVIPDSQGASKLLSGV